MATTALRIGCQFLVMDLQFLISTAYSDWTVWPTTNKSHCTSLQILPWRNTHFTWLPHWCQLLNLTNHSRQKHLPCDSFRRERWGSYVVLRSKTDEIEGRSSPQVWWTLNGDVSFGLSKINQESISPKFCSCLGSDQLAKSFNLSSSNSKMCRYRDWNLWLMSWEDQICTQEQLVHKRTSWTTPNLCAGRLHFL